MLCSLSSLVICMYVSQSFNERKVKFCEWICVRTSQPRFNRNNRSDYTMRKYRSLATQVIVWYPQQILECSQYFTIKICAASISWLLISLYKQASTSHSRGVSRRLIWNVTFWLWHNTLTVQLIWRAELKIGAGMSPQMCKVITRTMQHPGSGLLRNTGWTTFSWLALSYFNSETMVFVFLSHLEMECCRNDVGVKLLYLQIHNTLSSVSPRIEPSSGGKRKQWNK